MKRKLIAVDEKDFDVVKECLTTRGIDFISDKTPLEMYVYEICLMHVAFAMYDDWFDDMPDKYKDTVVRRVDEGGVYKSIMDAIGNDEYGEYISQENIAAKINKIMEANPYEC